MSGGDFPNPNTTYEASPKAKKRRISESKTLDDVFEANGKKPLPIQFDSKDYIYNAVGPNAIMFTKYIGNLIELGIPPYYLSWDHVPQEFKKPILPRLRHFFNLDRNLPEWPLIVAGIERECEYCYEDKMSRLKRHFDQIGGYHDVGNAQRNPPPHLDHKAWWRTVKLFLSREYMNRLMENREIYVNDPARIDHDQAAKEAKIVAILQKLKGSAFSSFLKPPQPPAMPPTHDTMKLLIDVLDDNMQFAHDVFNKLSCMYPHIQFPPPPTIDTQALLASVMPQPPLQHDDGDGDDGDDGDDYDDYGDGADDDDDDDGDGDDDDDGDGDDGDGGDDDYDDDYDDDDDGTDSYDD